MRPSGRWSAGMREDCFSATRGSSVARNQWSPPSVVLKKPIAAATAAAATAARPRGASGTRAAARARGGRRARTDARDRRVDHLRVARRDREIRLEHARQAVRQLLPVRAAVSRLEDAAVVRLRVAAESAAFDVALLLLPERGVDDVRIARIDADVVAADVLVLVENLLECRAAVGRAEDAALGVRAVRMAERRDEQPIRIARIDLDVRDHRRVAQRRDASTSCRRRWTCTCRRRSRGPGRMMPGAAADVNDVGIGRARPRSRRSIRSAGCRRAASTSIRSRSIATRRRCRSRCRRRWAGSARRTAPARGPRAADRSIATASANTSEDSRSGRASTPPAQSDTPRPAPHRESLFSPRDPSSWTP